MKKIDQKLTFRFFSVCFLIFILITSLLNTSIFAYATKKTIKEKSGFSGFVQNITDSYPSRFKAKTVYISVNGLFGRVTGRTEYNEVSVLKNGMLTKDSVQKPKFSKYAKALSEFDLYTQEKGIKFLYVQAPYKMDMNENLKTDGITNESNYYAEAMLKALRKHNVSTLDLRTIIASDIEAVEKNFYSTDHHWNTHGAFLAFQQICEKIFSTFPDKTVDTSFTNINNWQAKTYENWFLGSLGKRVGPFFGGVDDLTIYTPKPKTNISCFVSNHQTFYSGDFAKANIRESFLDKHDYFGENAYCAYIGGDYPLVSHKNSKAACDLKVLIIKDSYTLPVQAFMSTVFKEVDVIDPRHFEEGTIAEYVDCNKPDIVISLLNPSIMWRSAFFDYGVNEALNSSNKSACVFKNKNITIKGVSDKNDYETIFNGIKSNTKYTLSIPDIELINGDAKGVVVSLYNATTKKVITSRAIDLNFNYGKLGFNWTFISPKIKNQKLHLIVYAGTPDATKNNVVSIKNVSLHTY